MVAAVVLSRVLKSFLFEVEPNDPVTLIGVGLLFAAVALAVILFFPEGFLGLLHRARSA